MHFRDEEIIRKLKIVEPYQHKYLSYISKPLDLILFYDNVEAFKAYHEKYPHESMDTTLKACIEYGSASCFTHFFNTTRSPTFHFEKLFQKPESPSLGRQCAYYYIKNNKILNAMEAVCSTFFPEKTTLDFLTDKEQIEHCAARFGIKGRVKLAKKLLDKLDNPLYMVNNMSLFDSIYANKANDFCKVYLEHIEEKKLTRPFLITLFSKVNLRTHTKFINLFERFSIEDNKENPTHDNLNKFLIKNIQNGNISHEFQELMMAYFIRNNNFEKLNQYSEARPLSKQSLLNAMKEPWRFPDITDETHRYIGNSSNHEVYMENNAFKLFHHNESLVNQWGHTLREVGKPEFYSSIPSLFCLGDTKDIGKTIANLSSNINWKETDKKGNNFAHYLANFFGKMMKFHPNSSNATAMFTTMTFLIENNVETLITSNNNKVMPGEELLKIIKSGSTYTTYLKPEQRKDVEKMEKILEYAALNNELGHNTPTNTKRPKL
jgi:hypothetical protein